MAKSVYQILIELEGDKNAKSSLEDIGKAAGLTGAALTAFAAGAAKLAADYEKALGDISIVIDESTGTTESLSEATFDLQKELGGLINVQEAAVASAELLSSGIKGQDTILNALTSSQKAAVAGQSDLNTISSAAAGVVNSYGDALGEGLTQGEKFNKVVDLILRTQIDGVVTADEYARGIGNIASLASIAGISLEELNGAIALSTEKGTKASIAINNLKSAVSNITAPTKTAQDEAKRLGIEFDAARLKSVGLKQVVTDIFASEEFNEASLGKLFGSTEAQSIIAQLGSDLDTFGEKIDAQVNGLGTLDEAFGKVDETVRQRVTNSLNLLQGALIKIGDGVLIAFEPVLTIVSKLAALLSSLPTPVLATVGAVVGLTGVALTAGGAVLLLATSLGAMKANLDTGLPILIKMAKGIAGLATSALSGAAGLKSFSLATLTSNAQLQLLGKTAKITLASIAPMLVTLAAFAGAAASVALVVDTFNKMDSQAKKNRESLSTLEEEILKINKAGGSGEGINLVKDEELLKIQQIKEDLGPIQNFLDRIRGGAGLELAIAKGSEDFAKLNAGINDLGLGIRKVVNNSKDGVIPPEVLKNTQDQIAAIIVALEESNPTTQADIELRDQQIERYKAYAEALKPAEKATEGLGGATEETGQAAEEAQKKYDEYAKSVTNSVKRIETQTANSVAAIVGSESYKIQETLRLQEDGTNQQIALLENLKNQEGTSASERLNIETEIQTKRVELNKNRIEANKQLEEQYNQFLRDSNELAKVNFEQSQLDQNKTIAETFNQRKTLIQDTYQTELDILLARKATLVEGSAEEKAITLEIAQLKLDKTEQLRTLDEQASQERLAQIAALNEAEKSRLDLLTQASEIQLMMLNNSNAVLDSQASILGKISGLLEGDNATLGQRQELLKLAEEITGQTFVTNEKSSAIDQAKVAIQNQLASIEIQKLDLKIKQLEIDKEQLRIANEIKQLEISGQRQEIAEQLKSGNLTNQERQNLQRRDQTLANQSSLENRKTELGSQAIDNQLGFADLEKRLAEILTRNTEGTRAGDLLNNRFEDGSTGVAFENDSRIDPNLLTKEELQEIEDKQAERSERLAKEAEKTLEESKKTATNTGALASSQDNTTTQIAGQTEEIRNVSGSIGSLVEVASQQLRIQERMSARLDQISKQLDTLPTAIAQRLPRPTQPVNTRR